MRFTCDKCGRAYAVSDELAGRSFKMKCKGCGEQIVVRARAPSTAAPATPPAVATRTPVPSPAASPAAPTRTPAPRPAPPPEPSTAAPPRAPAPAEPDPLGPGSRTGIHPLATPIADVAVAAGVEPPAAAAAPHSDFTPTPAGPLPIAPAGATPQPSGERTFDEEDLFVDVSPTVEVAPLRPPPEPHETPVAREAVPSPAQPASSASTAPPATPAPPSTRPAPRAAIERPAPRRSPVPLVASIAALVAVAAATIWYVRRGADTPRPPEPPAAAAPAAPAAPAPVTAEPRPADGVATPPQAPAPAAPAAGATPGPSSPAVATPRPEPSRRTEPPSPAPRSPEPRPAPSPPARASAAAPQREQVPSAPAPAAAPAVPPPAAAQIQPASAAQAPAPQAAPPSAPAQQPPPPAAVAPAPAPSAPAPVAADSAASEPPSGATRYVTDGFQAPQLASKSCISENLRLPPALEGAVPDLVTTRVAVSQGGKPTTVQVMGQVADPRIAEAVRRAVQACDWIPGTDPQGKPAALWVVVPIRLTR